MIDIRFEVNGREVSLDRFASEMEKAVYGQVRDNIRERLEGVRCPEHGERPTVIVMGSSLDNLEFDVDGCCEELVNRVVGQLKQ